METTIGPLDQSSTLGSVRCIAFAGADCYVVISAAPYQWGSETIKSPEVTAYRLETGTSIKLQQSSEIGQLATSSQHTFVVGMTGGLRKAALYDIEGTGYPKVWLDGPTVGTFSGDGNLFIAGGNWDGLRIWHLETMTRVHGSRGKNREQTEEMPHLPAFQLEIQGHQALWVSVAADSHMAASISPFHVVLWDLTANLPMMRFNLSSEIFPSRTRVGLLSNSISTGGMLVIFGQASNNSPERITRVKYTIERESGVVSRY